MPAQYVKEPNGPIHLVRPTGDNEFTMCDRDHGMADSGGFEGHYCNGPATCQRCREEYISWKAGLKDVRWA